MPALRFAAGALALVMALSCLALLPRLSLENGNRDVAIIAEYREVFPLIRASGLSMAEALNYLKEKGIVGLMVKEYSAEDLHRDSVGSAHGPDRTGPDHDGLETAAESNMPVFYRVAPAPPWQTREALETTDSILAAYPNISVAAPSGDVALGHPDMGPLAELLKKHGVAAAQIEFSRQLGAAQLERLMFPQIIPLHSVTNEELNARRISRAVMHDRLVRAAAERSVRLLVMRPAVSGGAESPLEDFGAEVEKLAEDLQSHGLRLGWPKPALERRVWRMSFAAAGACSLAFLLFLGSYAKRLTQAGPLAQLTISYREAGAFLVSGCVLAALVWKVPAAARWVGAFSTVFAVTEASLAALDTERRGRVWVTLLWGFIYAAAGGLAVAALFSQPDYMLRLSTFSGVKLTLMLPPVLVVLHDMHRRVHPESLAEFLSRPPLWGELMLGVVLMGLMFLLVYRSGNVQFIPGMEADVRAALERLLVARPRSKEIFIGYPCVLLFAFAAKNGLWPRYREVFRAGAAVGLSSVVNSFCHYHTPLLFILLREFHGLWVGILFGIISVLCVKYIILPLSKRLLPLIQ